MIALLIIVIVILLACLSMSILLNIRAGGVILGYEKFYEDTIEDINQAVVFAARLKKREMIADNEDFRRLSDLIVIIHDTLINYTNAYRRAKKGKEKTS